MAWAYIQGVNQLTDYSGGSASPTQQFTTQNTAAGSLLVAICHVYLNSLTLNSVTDDQGNTWVIANSQIVGSSPYKEFICYALKTQGGTKALVTFHFSGATALFSCALLEYSGVNALRSSVFTTQTGPGAVSSGAITTAAGDLIIGVNQAQVGDTSTAFPPGTSPLTFTTRNYYGELITRVYGIVEDATATGTSSVANWANSASDVLLCSALAFYQKSSGGAGGGLNLAMDASLRNCGLRH
jgi:hypothetical protein